MLINETVSRDLMASMPDYFIPAPLSENFSASLRDAVPVDSILLELSPSDSDLYFSYFRQVQNQNPNLVFNNDPATLKPIEDRMILDMFHDNIPYSKIIRAMTTSPVTLYTDFSKNDFPGLILNEDSLRWSVSFAHVSKLINPMFCQESLQFSLSFHNISTTFPSDEAIYESALSTILKRSPSLSLVEADSYVVKLLQKNNNSLDTIKTIMQYSPQFSVDTLSLPDDAIERVGILNHIYEVKNDFINEALNSDMVIPKKESLPPAPTEETNDTILEKMKDELHNLQEHQYSSDAMNYWKDALNIIQKSFSALEIEKKQAVCEILLQWSDVIEKATFEMSLEENPEVKNIHDTAIQLKEKAELEEKEWEKLFVIVGNIEEFTQKMLTDTAAKIKEHPLMRNPNIYKATPYDVLIKTQNHKPHEIYYSLLRKVVLDKPNLGILEADTAVKNILDTAFRLNSKQKVSILSHSPRFDKLPQHTKEAEVNRWLSTVAVQERGGVAKN